MKKRVSILLYLLCFLSMTSCSRQEAYSFMHDPETIVKIEIVHVGEKNYEKMEIEQDVLLTIEDKTSFLKAFADVPCYRVFTDPKSILSDSYAIKIIYDNGEYELIGCSGQAKCSNNGKLNLDTGFRYFDESAFNAFIANCLEGKMD